MSNLSSSQEENGLLNLTEYREGLSHLKSRPRFLVVELTQICNLSCPMCRPDQSATVGRTMSNELFEQVAQELFPFAEMVDLRGWGESLILPDIIKRIEKSASYGVKIRFVTNLSFRRPDVLKALAAHGCYLAISVDAADAELFRLLRGGAKLDLVLANLDFLVNEYCKLFGNAERLHFTTTVQRPALPALSNIIDLAAQHGIREVRLFPVTVEAGSSLDIEKERREVDSALNGATRRGEQLGVKVIAGARLGSMPENPLDIPACLHPWAYAYIAYNGAVGFCDHLIGIAGEPYHIGHLGKASFDEIWNGAAWQALRREHLGERKKEAPLFHECAWCYKNRYIDFEHFFDPAAEARIIRLTASRSNSRA